jgi:hypothetical protein
MIYLNAAGDNVTLSPRLGTGNRQPQSDTTTAVTLLGGSGVSNGVMTANIRCNTHIFYHISWLISQVRTVTTGAVVR